jgi:N-acetylmuramoyl-L-alanine amidase
VGRGGEGGAVIRAVLDPGHGGPDPGAVCGVLREADLALELALGAARGLARHPVEVRLTREEDRYVPLAARAALANRWGADLLVSLHCNAALNPFARGFESYVHPAAYPATRTLRRAIHENLMLFLAPLGVPDRGMREADFCVLRRTRCPAVLLECLFLTNSEDAALLADPEFRDRLANEIAWAVAAALGVV